MRDSPSSPVSVLVRTDPFPPLATITTDEYTFAALGRGIGSFRGDNPNESDPGLEVRQPGLYRTDGELPSQIGLGAKQSARQY